MHVMHDRTVAGDRCPSHAPTHRVPSGSRPRSAGSRRCRSPARRRPALRRPGPACRTPTPARSSCSSASGSGPLPRGAPASIQCTSVCASSTRQRAIVLEDADVRIGVPRRHALACGRLRGSSARSPHDVVVRHREGPDAAGAVAGDAVVDQQRRDLVRVGDLAPGVPRLREP